MKVNKTDFRNTFKDILIDIGISPDKVDKFLKYGSTMTIEELGICTSISIIVDDRIKQRYKDYDGCLANETFEKIWDYNNKLINNPKDECYYENDTKINGRYVAK